MAKKRKTKQQKIRAEKNRKNQDLSHENIIPQKKVPEIEEVESAISRANKKQAISNYHTNKTPRSNLKFEDLVLIHTNDNLPSKDGTLETLTSAGIVDKMYVFIGSEVYPIDIKSTRNTKHFTLNCPVESHKMRNKSGKYGIVITDVSKVIEENNLIDIKSADVVFEKNVKLPNGYVLFVPKEEEAECRMTYRTAQVRSYEGDLNDAIIQYMLEKSIPVMKFSTSGWCKENGDKDIENENALANIISQNGLPYIEPYWFANGPYSGIEMTRYTTEGLLSIIKFLKNNNRKITFDDFMLNIELQFALTSTAACGLGTIRSPKFTIDGFIKGVYEIFEENNLQVPEGFYTTIKKDFKGNEKICKAINMGDFYTFKEGAIFTVDINNITKAIKPSSKMLSAPDARNYLYTANQPLDDGSKSPGSLIYVKDARNVVLVTPHWRETAIKFIAQKMLEREGLLETMERPIETNLSDSRIVEGLTNIPTNLFEQTKKLIWR